MSPRHPRRLAAAPTAGHRNAESAAGQGPSLLPDPVAAIRALRDRFATRRKLLTAPLHVDADGNPAGETAGFPATNHSDVRWVCNHVSLALRNDQRALGPTAHPIIWNHWRGVVQTIETLLRLGKNADVYADNEGFWLRQLPAVADLIADAITGGMRNRSSLRLTFRGVGDVGDPYPEWVQALRGRSGVYVIRVRQDDGSNPIVYVGSSRGDRLYDTLTRHFQSWRRRKGRGYFRGQFVVSRHDPGLTWDRSRCRVAVIVTSPDDALALESQMISRLAPLENKLGQDPSDDDGAADESLEPLPF